MVDAAPRTTVIGLGNPLMGDDAVGLRALERLETNWHVPATIELVDGGTWGMNLLHVIEDATSLLFLDAVDRGVAPGTLIVLDNGEIPRALLLKVSPHQVDLREVLAVAQLRGRIPPRMTLIGLQPERIELGEALSPRVEAQLDVLVSAAADRLTGWGETCTPRRVTVDA
jgi:hydrogenase maturation protease